MVVAGVDLSSLGPLGVLVGNSLPLYHVVLYHFLLLILPHQLLFLHLKRHFLLRALYFPNLLVNYFQI